jgi:hypothetical protein
MKIGTVDFNRVCPVEFRINCIVASQGWMLHMNLCFTNVASMILLRDFSSYA